MGDLTRSFSLWEFACKDGTPVPPEYLPNVQRLAEQLQALRDYTGKAITVNSGFRTPAYNEGLPGASSSSHHLTASAADITVALMTPTQVYCTIEGLIAVGAMEQGGLGIYAYHVHYDWRDDGDRWAKGRGVAIPQCDSIIQEVRSKMGELEDLRAKLTYAEAVVDQVIAERDEARQERDSGKLYIENLAKRIEKIIAVAKGE